MSDTNPPDWHCCLAMALTALLVLAAVGAGVLLAHWLPSGWVPGGDARPVDYWILLRD